VKAVHIGFPKTATKFLQKTVFPRIAGPGFTYVPLETSVELFASLIDDDDTIYDEAATVEHVRNAAPESASVLFSHEGLTGQPYRGGFMNRSQIAERLARAGFDKVLVTIRNQADALESAYKQYVAIGGVLRLRDYVTFDPAQAGHLNPQYFDYHRIYELYVSIFGRSNVLVLQYERLVEPTFLEQLTRFLCAKPVTVDVGELVNPSLSFEKAAVLRFCNHFVHSTLRPSSLLPKRVSTGAVRRLLARLPFGNSGRSFHDERSRAEVARFYAESNRRLEGAAGITLAPAYPT
jgi:hypothetical protein